MAHNDLVQSLVRTMDILDLLSTAESGLSMQEICRSLGIKQPTAYNLIRTLMTRGYIGKTSPPVRYHLGGGITRLYEQRLRHNVVRRANDVMLRRFEDVLTRIHKPVNAEQEAAMSFAQGNGDELRMLLRVRAYRPKIVERLPNFHFGAYTTTSALLYHAFCSPEERSAYQQRHRFDELGVRIWKSEKAFRRQIELTRERGYALLPSYPPNEFRVSVPVLDARKWLLGVLGLGVFGYPLSEDDKQAFINILLESAQDIADYSNEA